jgi:hypothetical protein
MEPEPGAGASTFVISATRELECGDCGEEASSSKGVRSWLQEELARVAGAAANRARTAALSDLGRITKIRPRMAGSDLQEARAAAARAAAEGGVD